MILSQIKGTNFLKIGVKADYCNQSKIFGNLL